MDTIPFPDTRADRLAENALEELGNWVESQIELGVSPITLIGLMETYKSSLCYNLLEDEEYD
jgi:hypothetical protein